MFTFFLSAWAIQRHLKSQIDRLQKLSFVWTRGEYLLVFPDKSSGKSLLFFQDLLKELGIVCYFWLFSSRKSLSRSCKIFTPGLDFLWLCMNLYDCVWLCMTMQGCPTWGEWGGHPPIKACPPHPNNFESPPWTLLSPPWLKIFCTLRAWFRYFICISL